MSMSLKPWTRAVFEMIVHAEKHLRDGGDFDRRMAHIGFDNAIEVSIATYLGLNPIQRNGKTYKREDVDKWLKNYHTKLDFLESEAKARGCKLKVPNDEIVFYHDIRNNLYHAGGPGVPEAEHLRVLRTAALDVFAMLFCVNDVEQILEQQLLCQSPTAPERRVVRNKIVDRLLDMADMPVVIAGQSYAVSDVLYATDEASYQAVATAVTESRNVRDELSEKYSGWVRPDIGHIGFVHYENVVYLKIELYSGEINLTEAEFVADGPAMKPFFSPSRSPDENADRLVNQLDAYSIINCFELFTEEAAAKIAHTYESSSAKLPSA